eukprot:3608202-Prymnesium_polylepis.1
MLDPTPSLQYNVIAALSPQGGDAHLRGLAESALAKQEAKKQKADGITARKEEAAEKKALLEAEASRRSRRARQCALAASCHARGPRCTTAPRAGTSRGPCAGRRF